MSDKILSAEDIAAFRADRIDLDPEFLIANLCNSHEALRAERDAARGALKEAERAKAALGLTIYELQTRDERQQR